MHRHGAHLLDATSARFALWAPDARSVSLELQQQPAIELLRPAPCLGTVLNRYHGLIGGDDYGFGYASQRNYDAYYS